MGKLKQKALDSFTAKMFFSSLLVSLLVLFPPVVSADDDDEIDTEIDWEGRFTQVVDIKTEPLANYLRKDKHQFDNLVLARVSSQSPKEKNSKKYEVIWYRKGDPIGVRRLNGLAFQAPQRIALHVLHSSLPASDDDVKSEANACLRLYLELYAKTMSPSAIVVPKQSFNSFVQRMNQLNFYSAEEPEPNTPVRTSIILSVESEPPGLRQLLFYSGSGL